MGYFSVNICCFLFLEPILLNSWAVVYATNYSLIILDNFTVQTHFPLKNYRYT